MTVADFESVVEQVMIHGNKSRELAEQLVRQQLPHLVPRVSIAAKREDLLEREEQAFIYKLFRGYGFMVRNLSQARASKQAPGLGDAWCTHKTQPIAFWWESKRQIGGKLSADQIEMRDDCLRCGVGYHSGDRHDAARLLVSLGLARVGDGQCGIIPFHDAR
jgi:hypothetical protein